MRGFSKRMVFLVSSLAVLAAPAAFAGQATFVASTDFAAGVGSAIVRDSTGAVVASEIWNQGLPVGHDAETGGAYLPVRVLAGLRDDVQEGSSPDRERILGALGSMLGSHRSTPITDVPSSLLAEAIYFAVKSFYCGEYVHSLTHECMGSCISTCGVGKEKCCGCACYGEAELL